MKKEFRNLDREIKFVQIQQNFDNFDKSMKNEIKTSMKKFLTFIIPSLISIAAIVIFPKLITLIASLTTITAVFTINFIKNVKKEKKEAKKIEGKILNINPEIKQEEDETLQGKFLEQKCEDFYTSNYKQTIAKNNTEEAKKYREALEKQRIKSTSEYDSKMDEHGQIYFNKDETIEQIVEEIEAFYTAYKLPPLKIINNDWDNFIDVLYEKFVEKGIENKFYNSLSIICRLTFAKMLVNKNTYICINDLITNLCYLEDEYQILGLSFSKSCVKLYD